jgi:glycosyltransferase involved in cell wall biosynthesis
MTFPKRASEISPDIASRLCIDGSSFNPTAADGLNRYVGEILTGFLSRSSPLQVYTAATALYQQYPTKVKAINSRSIYLNNFRGNVSRLLWHQTELPRMLKQNAIEHKNSPILYSPVPEGMLFPVCPQVITIHDILPIRFPQTYPRIRYYFRYILPRLIAASQAIVAVSEYTKQEIEAYFGEIDKPIHVIYQGYRSDIFKPASIEVQTQVCQQYNLNSFILGVGETRPYKNIRGLIEAFARVKLPDITLAIVGQLNKLDLALQQLPDRLGIGDRVKFLGYVPDTDLAALYSAAQAFVFPSLYEGFGIPPLEAMGCGCPVIASQVAAISEVCGCAAYYIDPTQIESISDSIYRVLTNEKIQNYLKFQGVEQARKFEKNNNSMVDQVIEILPRSQLT